MVLVRYLQLGARGDGLHMAFPRHHMVPLYGAAGQLQACLGELYSAGRLDSGHYYSRLVREATERWTNPSRYVSTQLAHSARTTVPGRGAQGQ